MSDSDRLLSDAERDLFAKFFAGLEAAGIVAVLLRNYEDFPASIGHDLDLFVRRREALAASQIFRALLAAAGGTVLIVHERDYFIDIRFVLNTSAANAIHLDIYHGSFTWHSLHYLTEEKLLAGSLPCQGLLIPRPAHEAFNIFFASILWGGFYKARYQPRIAALLATPVERAEFDCCTLEAFGAAGSPPFDPCSSTLPGKSEVKTYAARLRRAFKRQSFRHAPLQTVIRLARHWRVEFGCLLRPKGLLIAVTGPDDVDKLAAIEGLLQRVGELFTERQVYHLSPEKPSGLASPNRLSASGRLLKEWCKCWWRWPVRGWKKKAQSQLIIFERYTEDWWCNPACYGFGGLPGWWVKLFARTTPQPDFVFLLTPNDGLTVSSRYESWAKLGRRRFIVDAAQPEPAILDCLESIVVAYIRAREVPH